MPLFTVAYLLFLVAPILLLAVGSVGGVWTNTLLPEGFTTEWYRNVWDDGSFRRAFVVSLWVCLATCAATAAIGLPLAYAVYGAARRGVKVAVRLLYLMPVAAPPLVLGFGFILVFSTDELPFLGAPWLLVCGHVVLTLPYLMQTLVADMRHLNLGALERAAESLGAGFAQRFLGVVVPSLRHSLASGLIMVAALSIGEFQLSNLIAGFLSRPYPVVLLQAFYGATGFACAATVILLALALISGAAAGAAGHGKVGVAGGRT